MSHTDIVTEHAAIRNYLSEHRLPLYFSKPVMSHIETYMVASTAKGFQGKVSDLAEYSDCHRTSIGHFLAQGNWDESVLQRQVRTKSLSQVTEISKHTTEPLFVIHDDTIVQKTKPSSQAKSPMERTGFHHSHLLGKVVFGHQLQATVMACADVSLIHSIDLYDKSQIHPDGKVVTKIDQVCALAKTLPVPPYGGYALVDSWFTCPRVIDAYAAQATISLVRSKRIAFYIRKASELQCKTSRSISKSQTFAS